VGTSRAAAVGVGWVLWFGGGHVGETGVGDRYGHLTPTPDLDRIRPVSHRWRPCRAEPQPHVQSQPILILRSLSP
jgi:hypothetical protein